MRHAKIVCTLGPSTLSYERICQLIQAGMDVARLNFSHGDHAQHREAFEHVRKASEELGKPVAVLADLSGPKIRLGDVAGKQVEVAEGSLLTITTRKVEGNAQIVSTNYKHLPTDVEPGGSIFCDDGLLEFVVSEVKGEDVVCTVKTGGMLRSRKGLNIPYAKLSTPALTQKDKRDLSFGKELGVEFFALSFVRTPQDVLDAKELAGGTPVIAKIEKPSAVDDIDAIADACDGLMVARGDLGVEVGYEKVPLLQKRLIRAMIRRAKPVITATQMLESMVSNPRPTRAETSDVANAVLDGTDAVMLSAETAAGKYPVQAVKTMSQIITEVESSAISEGMLQPPAKVYAPAFQHAIAHAAAMAAVELNLKAVVVHSVTGKSLARVSAYRPRAPIAGFSADNAVLRRASLLWGITPIFAEQTSRVDDVVRQSEEALIQHGLANPGDEIAITFGMQDGGPVGTTVMKLWKVRG